MASLKDRLDRLQHDGDLNLEDHAIYLFGAESRASCVGEGDDGEPGVEYVMANRLIRNLETLKVRNPNKDILIHMKTNGGFWEEGMAIYDAIRACPVHVTILNYTHARSMSSLIFLAANKRVMMPHSSFMFHMGTMGMYGTVKSFMSFAEFERRMAQPTMLDIYTDALKEQGKHKHKSPAKIRELLQFNMDKKEEVYLTAKEAVQWGFADEVFDGNWKKLRKYTKKHKDRG
jgi:ATP-dependent protease ClpP protease subunit